MRQSNVLDNNATFSDTWGDLEVEGLAALNLNKPLSIKGAHSHKMDLTAAVDVGNVDVQVEFFPLPLFHLADKQLALPGSKTWAFSVPSVHEKWWNKIEGAHATVLMFKLQLLRVSYGRDMFTVLDFFPPYVSVPRRLQSLCFEMPFED
ncbi:hypothetical protein GOP47_0028966 [Adiantum capillus-veneris]|nr:hypothetical protein GOP47_0028966 [Adiantum capillus-veneris]